MDSQMDPMEIVRNALAYGRQQMGLPEEFYRTVTTPSFDEGGVVPDPSQGGEPSSQGGSMPDPRVAMKYLSGDGAVAPDIVSALEQQVDPDGAMDPSERMMEVLQRTPSPDAAFGVMQHYRTKFNAYSGAARAAMSQGDLAHAAAYATQAFANLPTGQSVQFAPANGGLAMVTRPHGNRTSEAPTSPSFRGGGKVAGTADSDSSNPDNGYNEDGSEVESYDNGGGVVDPYESMPESGNIEDRRNQTVEGWVPKQDGPDPERAGIAQKERYSEHRNRRSIQDEGVIPKQRAFDDGGEVSDDDLTTGSSGGGNWEDQFVRKFPPGAEKPYAQEFEENSARHWRPYAQPDEPWRDTAKRVRRSGYVLDPDSMTGISSMTGDEWQAKYPPDPRDAPGRRNQDHTEADLRPDAPADTYRRFPYKYNLARTNNAPTSDSGQDSGSPPPAVLSAQEMNELLASGYDKIVEKAAGPRTVQAQAQPPLPTSPTPQAPRAESPAQPPRSASPSNEPPLPTPQQPNPPPPVDNGKLGNVFGPMSRGDFQGAGEGLMTNMRRRIRPASAGPTGELPPDATQEPGGPATPQAASRAPARGPQEPNYDDLPPAPGKPRGYTPQESPKDQSRHEKTRGGFTTSEERTPEGNIRQRMVANGEGRQQQGDPEQQAMDKYRRVANQLFPWVSQGKQRNDYIMQRMAADGAQSGKMEIEREHTKRGVDVAKIGATSREGIATQRVEHQDARALQKNMSDQTRAAMKEVVSRWNHTERTEAQLIGQKLMADPSYMGSPEHKQRENELRAKTNMSAQDIQNAVIAMIPSQGGGQAAPAPQGAAPAQGGSQQMFSPKTGPYAGKVMILKPNGRYELAPGQ